MGQIRLYVEATKPLEAFVPIPEYWDEMDSEEQEDWAQESLADFVTKHVKSGYEVNK